MKIYTGKDYISPIILISVLSLSLVVNLPGLAITPIISTISNEFKASDFTVQLLTMLPNICIIPLMLCSDFLIKKFSKTSVSALSLIIFSVCGILFFFAKDMTSLIILSCLIGCSCGVLIPIAASMITDLFIGSYRVKQLGIKSGIANISLVLATFAVGWLSGFSNWKLPFLVYLIPLIPLLFIGGIRKAEKDSQWRKSDTNDTNSNATDSSTTAPKMNITHLSALMGLYFFITYSVIVLPYYLGLDETKLDIDNQWIGTITSIFYLLIFLAGSFLGFIVKKIRGLTLILAALSMTIGLFIIASGVSPWIMCICGALMGYGYGIFQPIIYTKAAEVAGSKLNTTKALSWVMGMNYLSIAISPLIIDGIRLIVGTSSNIFPFYLNAIICGLFTILIIIKRNSFAFNINNQYYS